MSLSEELAIVSNTLYTVTELRSWPRNHEHAEFERFVATLRGAAVRLHPLYERACSKPETRLERLETLRTEARIVALAHEFEFTLTFDKDPHGAPLRVDLPKPYASFGNHPEGGLVVPYLPAKEYR